jgi:alpha-glucosidase
MAYSFELLVDTFSADYIRETVSTLEAGIGDGWPCWSIGNHDVVRVMSRWGGDNQAPAKAKLLSALLFSLRGSVCSYQGEELGLPEADLQFHQLQDPYGITFWPSFKGRDGCRTPMPWQESGELAGFTEGKPWLPVPSTHRSLAVDVQDRSEHSVLNAYRTFLHWRRQQDVLKYGDIDFVDCVENVLAFTRQYKGRTLVAYFNLCEKQVNVDLPFDRDSCELLGHGFSPSQIGVNKITLSAYGAYFGELI